MKKVNLLFNAYYEEKLEDYIQSKWSNASRKETEKLVKILMELYTFLTLKQKENKVEIQVNYLKTKWRITFNGQRRKYRFLLDILIETGLIEQSEHYYYGNDREPFCKTINLLDKSEEAFRRKTEIDLGILKAKPISIDKITTKPIKTKEEWIELWPQYKNIIETHYNSEYNLEELLNYLWQNLNKLDDKGRTLTVDKIMTIYNEAALYNARVFFFVEGEGTGRLYTTGARQSSFVRGMIKGSEGQNLIELDIKNNQPLLLSNYIQHDKYKEDVEAGIFYDEVLNDYNKTYSKNLTRHQIKEELYRRVFFNDKPLTDTQGKLYGTMERLYKGLIEQINRLKQDNKLWQILQTAEADIFIKGLQKINKDYISIHDGILVKEEDKELFIEAIMNLYKERNLTPQISIK